MSPLILIWVSSLACMGILARQRRGGDGSAPFALAILPIALLFLTVPVALAVLHLIRGFQQIAEQGRGGMQLVAPFCLDISRSLLFGGISVMAAIGIAALVQFLTPPGTSGEDAPVSQPALGAWMLGALAIVIVAVGFEDSLSAGISRLVMQTGFRFLQGTGPPPSGAMAQASQTIASQALLAVLLGAALSALLASLGLVNLLTARRWMGSSPSRYSWLVLAAAGVLACWIIFRAMSDLDTFQVVLG